MKEQLRTAEGILIVTILFTFLLCHGLNASEETLPKPEEIIVKNIEAIGGIKALQKIKNKKIVMGIKVGQMEMDSTIYQVRPDKSYSITSVGAIGEEKSGSDGKMAWTVSAFSGTRLLEGDELSNMLIQNMFDGPDGPDVSYKSMNTEGIEEVNGKACYKVVKTPEKGPERIIYYDKKSFMIVKILTDIITPQGTFKKETYIEEYQKVNNILFPYKTAEFLMGRKYSEATFNKIELNIEMPENIFDIPEEIRAISAGEKKRKTIPNDLSVQVDHLVICISNLDDGIKQFYELSGIKPVFSGKHPGRSTQNALVSLDQQQYLEILAPTSEADFSLFNNFGKLTPMNWAVSTDNIEGLKEKLRAHNFKTSVPVSGSRVLPDNSILEWSTFSVTEPKIKLAPFFIQWSVKSNHPSKTSPVGCRLNKLELFTPTSDELKDLLTVLDLNINVIKSNNPKLKIELESPNGMIELETEDGLKYPW